MKIWMYLFALLSLSALSGTAFAMQNVAIKHETDADQALIDAIGAGNVGKALEALDSGKVVMERIFMFTQQYPLEMLFSTKKLSNDDFIKIAEKLLKKVLMLGH